VNAVCACARSAIHQNPKIATQHSKGLIVSVVRVERCTIVYKHRLIVEWSNPNLFQSFEIFSVRWNIFNCNRLFERMYFACFGNTEVWKATNRAPRYQTGKSAAFKHEANCDRET
jgi:hypothetical protein